MCLFLYGGVRWGFYIFYGVFGSLERVLRFRGLGGGGEGRRRR